MKYSLSPSPQLHLCKNIIPSSSSSSSTLLSFSFSLLPPCCFVLRGIRKHNKSRGSLSWNTQVATFIPSLLSLPHLLRVATSNRRPFLLLGPGSRSIQFSSMLVKLRISRSARENMEAINPTMTVKEDGQKPKMIERELKEKKKQE